MPNLVEQLARIEHEQWIEWSKAVAHEVSAERRARWERLWATPYEDLSEEAKEADRKYAKKVIASLWGANVS